MDLKKRKADFQITPVDTTVNDNADEEQKHDVQQEVPVNTETPVEVSTGFGGFSAYSKINPFAAAMGTNGFKNAFSSNSNDTGSIFGSRSFGKAAEVLPPLVVPSPKSPKINPFSTPSPKLNPFMTIVDSKDDLWQTMAKDKLSADETKSFFFNDDKSVPKSATNNSQFGSGFGNGFSAVTDSKKEDGDDEDGGGDEEEDGARADSPSFVKYTMPDVPVVTGEEQDQSLLQVRAKLFRLNTVKVGATETVHKASVPTHFVAPSSSSSSSLIGGASSESATDETESDAKKAGAEWVEVGIGPVKLLSRAVKSDSPIPSSVGRLVMRREEKKGGIGTKLLLNVRLDQFVSVTRQADKVVRLICINFTDPLPSAGSARPAAGLIGESVGDSPPSSAQTAESSGPTLQTYLLKTKTAQESDDLVAIAADFVSRSKDVAASALIGTSSSNSELTQTTSEASLSDRRDDQQ